MRRFQTCCFGCALLSEEGSGRLSDLCHIAQHTGIQMHNTMASSSFNPARFHGDNYQPQLLKITLSDLDVKMKAVMALVEEDEGSPAHPLKTRNSKIPGLLQGLGDFRGSYLSFAEICDAMFSESEHMPQSVPDCPKPITVHSHEDSATEYTDAYNMYRLPDDLISNDPQENDSRVETQVIADQIMDTIKAGVFQSSSLASSEMKTWVTKLMEEHLRQQAELVKRNNEKRARIQRLQLQMERLKGENLVLRNSIGYSGKDKRRSRLQIQSLSKLFKQLLQKTLFVK